MIFIKRNGACCAIVVWVSPKIFLGGKINLKNKPRLFDTLLFRHYYIITIKYIIIIHFI